jgi:hypothetical protein
VLELLNKQYHLLSVNAHLWERFALPSAEKDYKKRLAAAEAIVEMKALL